MDFKELREYGKKNEYALNTLKKANEDYISSRCLIISGLLTNGLVMAEQAVEKYLKTYIKMKDDTLDPKKISHRLKDLANIAETNGLDLTSYSRTINRLTEFYKHRYADNKISIVDKKSEELFEVDSLIFYINNKLDLPLQVKYGVGIEYFTTFHLIHSVDIEKNFYLKWLQSENSEFNKNRDKIIKEYLEYKEFLKRES